MKDCSFGWGFKVATAAESLKSNANAQIELEEIEEPLLTGLNVDLKYNDFLVIVGQTGVGKTTLLYSIMQENVKTKGESTTNGTIAYVE